MEGFSEVSIRIIGPWIYAFQGLSLDQMYAESTHIGCILFTYKSRKYLIFFTFPENFSAT